MPQPPAPLAGAPELFALDPTVAHLNHGSFGATPISVARARRALLKEYDANPMLFVTSGLRERISRARQLMATSCGADPVRTAWVANATTGIALAIAAVGLRDGDEVVLTDHGHDAVRLAVNEMRRRCGIRVAVAPVELGAPDDDAVEAVLSAVSERTRLVIVDQVSSATAQRHPVTNIAAALRDRGVPLLVDGAHGPGMLAAAAQVDADFWVGSMHKWSFAPSGSALLQVSERWRDRMVPLVVSHGQPYGFPSNVEESGTQDYSSWLASPAALAVFDYFGPERMREHNVALAAYGQQVVAAAIGIDPAKVPDPGAEVSMRILPLPAHAAGNEAAAELLRRRISTALHTEVHVKVWRHRAYLRLSAQIYNNAAEYDRLAMQLPALIR